MAIGKFALLGFAPRGSTGLNVEIRSRSAVAAHTVYRSSRGRVRDMGIGSEASEMSA